MNNSLKAGTMRQKVAAAVLILAIFIPLLLRGETEAVTTRSLSRPQTSLLLASQQDRAATEEAAAVDYSLPYPGILPDHPLYPLKVIRDRILELLIRDPLRKIDFYLLMADKRLNMGIFLTKQGKPVLAETTVSKGEKYFLRGVTAIRKMQLEQAPLSSEAVVSKYKKAIRKHAAVIKALQKKAPENIKTGYAASLDLVQRLRQELDGLAN